MSTEKTPLASPNTNFGSAETIPFYVQDARRFYSRRRRERQLQCIMFITIVATFIMALVITISYSVSHPDVVPTENEAGQGQETGYVPPNLLKSAGSAKYRSSDPNALNDDEIQLAVAAGKAAIAARQAADSATRPLPSPSPNSRHQYAVSTSSRADRLALTGLAELAATRKIETARSFMGKPSSFGSFLDGGWSTDDVCVNNLYIKCPVYAAKYRRFDGSCNDPHQRGMAFTPFKRVLPPDYADGIESPRTGKFGNPLPSAREVSLKVHAPSPSSNPSFTVMLAVFGQFLDHDVTATAISQGNNGSSLTCCPPNGGSHPECFPVRVGPGDPVFDLTETSCLEFVRSAPAPQCKIGPRQQLNQVTSFIDGSMIYGSDIDTAEELREFKGGLLRMQVTPDNRLLLPPSTNPLDGCNRQLELARGRYCFASGDARANENLHLTTMHLLWARQHNLLANQLAELNPQWDDETVYQEARKIVGAQLQHITYNEFLPIVLGEAEMDQYQLRPLADGFRPKNDSDVDPAIANHFAAAAFRFAHTLLPGLMKVTDTDKGTSSYVQLHKMLFNPYSLYAEGGVESSVTAAVSNTIQKTSTHVTSQLTAHLFEDPLGNKTVPCGLDLVSLNIQRGRDHGLPGYTKWREHCGLTKPLKFDDLKDDMDTEALDSISKLYDNVDDVDLYTGALAEIPRGDGLLGPTFTCLIVNQFQRLQQGDKYWYEFTNQSGSFNDDQLKELRKTSLARVICDTSDGITEVQAKVMRSVGPDNPMISCEDIPKVSLTAWKSPIPVLALTESEVPAEDWLNFKTEVNKTINDIVSNIIAKKPPPGSLPTDWLSFKQDINNTFSDLRNKFSMLHPKVVTNVSLKRNLTAVPDGFDWMGVKSDVDNAVGDILDVIYANKPGPTSPPGDWFAFKKKINDSIVDIRNKFKVIHPTVKSTQYSTVNLREVGDVPVVDWTEIKNSINSTITDVINNINASKPLPGSTPAAWFAFRKKINDSLSGIKNKFAGLYPKKVDLAAATDTFDWMSIKNDVDKAVEDILDSVSANKPGPDSPPGDWFAFKKKINDSLVDIKKKFKVIHPAAPKLKGSEPVSKTVPKVGDIPAFDWAEIKNSINATIMDVINTINGSKPLPGSAPAAWFEFRKKINDSLSDLKDKFDSIIPKDNLKIASDDTPFNWIEFKDKLNKTLTDLISSVVAKRPAPGSTTADWANFEKEINATFSQFMNQFADLHPKTDPKLLVKDEAPDILNGNDTSDATDTSNVNKTITEILDEIKANRPPPGSPPEDWTAFRQKMNNTFANMKRKYAYLYPRVASANVVNLRAPPADSTFDAVAFKENLNKSLTDLISYIKTKKPTIDSPITDWFAYKQHIKDSVTNLKDKISGFTTKQLLEPDYTLYLTEDGSSLDEQKWNETIDDLTEDIKSSLPNDDVTSANIKNYLSKSLTDLKNSVINLQVKKPQSRLMAIVEQDWLNFKDRVNTTIEDALDDVITNKPAPGDPAWVNYGIYIKNRFAQAKDDIKAVKTDWLEKVKAATDIMTVTTARPADSSALSVTAKLSVTKYYIIGFVFTVAFLI